MKINGAVVGCGAFANDAHLPNIRKSDLFDLAATCDSRREAAEAAKVTFNSARCCTDWRDVVAASDVELIILATHTSLPGGRQAVGRFQEAGLL